MIEPKELLNRIKSEFPNLTWRGYEAVDKGWDHYVIILDEWIVFRFPDSEYLEYLKDEVGLLKYLGGLIEARVPQYKYVASDNSFGGYELVPGVELTREVYDGMSSGHKKDVTAQLARFLTQIHTVPLPEIERYNVTRPDLQEEYGDLRRGVEEHLQARLSGEEYVLVQGILTDVGRVINETTARVLVHRDVYEQHLLWDHDASRLGVIDFSDRAIADPARDFAELYLYGEEFVYDVYAAYGGPKESGFLARTKVYQKMMGVDLMVDACVDGKISFDEAKAYFDRVANL